MGLEMGFEEGQMVAQQLGLSISQTAALVWGFLVCRDECQKWSLGNAEAVMNQWHGHERSRLSDAHRKRKLAQLLWSDRCATVDAIAKLILIERCHSTQWIAVWPQATCDGAELSVPSSHDRRVSIARFLSTFSRCRSLSQRSFSIALSLSLSLPGDGSAALAWHCFPSPSPSPPVLASEGAHSAQWIGNWLVCHNVNQQLC